jgi:parvulin-like peptidyl-prolyl isomerase
MKPNFLTRLFSIVFLASLCAFFSPALAQEAGEPVVIDEVIAQVNNDIVTLSMVRRETAQAVRSLMQQQNMTEQQATEEVARRQPELIAGLIVEQLLVQKGRELGFAEDVEAEVNRRLLELGRQQNLTTVQALEEAMRASNIDPAEFRQSARRGIMQSMVLSREVDARIYYGLTSEELRRYFDQNRERFRRPEMLTLSEIFLTIEGRQEAEVRARAESIVQQARAAGADFGALATANSDRAETRAARGRIGAFSLSEISRPEVASAIRTLQAGGVTNPIRLNDGFLILRVDERTPVVEPTFEENRVREAILEERAPREREAYRRRLFQEAYVQINENYRAPIEAVINRNTTASAPTTTAPAQQTNTTTTPAPANSSQNQRTNNNQNRRP